jgi:hypothetical protein
LARGSPGPHEWDDLAAGEDVDAGGAGQRERQVLLDEEDREAFALELADDPADLAHERRGQTLGGFVRGST